MINLTVKKTIKCEFTPDQWELYTHMFEDKQLRQVACNLNESLENLYNKGLSRKFTLETMMDELKLYKHYGAYDSEPINFLESVLNKIYGE